jgi:chromosome segregation ATPase
MRTEFQAQLALLQAELSQKEWALEEQRAAASGMDLAHREEIEALRQQVAQTETRTQENPDQFVLGDETLTEDQQQRRKKYREVIDAVTSGDHRSFPASENRRWRSRFGWKRRWK